MADLEKKSPCDECPGEYLAGTCASITELGRCSQELRRKALEEYESLPKIHGELCELNGFLTLLYNLSNMDRTLKEAGFKPGEKVEMLIRKVK